MEHAFSLYYSHVQSEMNGGVCIRVIFYTKLILFFFFFCRAAHCASFPTRYVQPPVISFEAVFEQSSPYSPVVFILSPGCDPVSDLMKLAERTGFGGNRLKFLAMGQGQEQVTSVGGLGRSVGTELACELQIMLLWSWTCPNFLSEGHRK